MKTLLWMTSLLLVGCSTFANTPAQDRTWARVEQCGGNSLNVTVAPNGAWRGYGSYGGDNREFVNCMQGTWR